jgi:hypothetical protein
MSDEALLSYSVGHQVRNECLQRGLGEPSGRQIAGCPGTRSSSGHERGGALGLRRQPVQGATHEIACDTLALEVVCDEEIAGPSTCEQCGTAGSEPLVVDEPCSLHGLESLAPEAGPNPTGSELSLERDGRMIACVECAERNSLRLMAPELSPERSGALSVDLDTDGEPRGEQRCCGDDTPRPTVEIDLDAGAAASGDPTRSERRDHGSHHRCAVEGLAAVTPLASLP